MAFESMVRQTLDSTEGWIMQATKRLLAILMLSILYMACQSPAFVSAQQPPDTGKQASNTTKTQSGGLEFKDFLPLIGVAIGGALTVLGGFLANYFLRKTNERTEKRLFYREQLEQIYLLGSQLVDYVTAEYTEVLQSTQQRENEKREKGDKPENPIARLKMTVSFYHPNLFPYIELIEKCLEDFYNGRGAFYLHLLERKTDPPLADVFKKEVSAPYVRLKETYKELVNAAENSVKDYT